MSDKKAEVIDLTEDSPDSESLCDPEDSYDRDFISGSYNSDDDSFSVEVEIFD